MFIFPRCFRQSPPLLRCPLLRPRWKSLRHPALRSPVQTCIYRSLEPRVLHVPTVYAPRSSAVRCFARASRAPEPLLFPMPVPPCAKTACALRNSAASVVSEDIYEYVEHDCGEFCWCKIVVAIEDCLETLILAGYGK